MARCGDGMETGMQLNKGWVNGEGSMDPSFVPLDPACSRSGRASKWWHQSGTAGGTNRGAGIRAFRALLHTKSPLFKNSNSCVQDAMPAIFGDPVEKIFGPAVMLLAGRVDA